MNLAPQVETAELADAELDALAGGQAGSAGFALGLHAAPGSLGLHVEAGDVAVSAGVGASVSASGFSADGHLHTTMY
ncbi:hypothetical protein ABZ606_05070 [Streptomyces sp. NPDC012461]|uniref:Type A2 lantipeptide n=2 Tax=unclassified Streptomyces TaxID=2593676 RepID=A0A6G3QY25_9ACTN|nr:MULTISPECIES: hypothetical protein [unclassified Streptomyces]MBM7088584.1 hypothetical protein [Streptomyces sp. S12]NEA88087.1 hypothetical protein [Streptomyces sp. SID14436]NEC81007.1 hypothetical protein [Streptomyces sp. SID7958]NED23298.1 hypothetical protein [Streptomyces sp. SID9913]